MIQLGKAVLVLRPLVSASGDKIKWGADGMISKRKACAILYTTISSSTALELNPGLFTEV
jgi:hypothetical protein